MLVLLSDIHRLKFALIFFFVYLLVNVKYKKYIFLLLSVLAHFQIFLYCLYKAIHFLIYKCSRNLLAIYLIGLVFIMSYIYAVEFVIQCPRICDYFFQNINNKLSYYMENSKINYYTILMLVIYFPYIFYHYYLRLSDEFNKILLLSLLALTVSVILNFYRLNILIFAYIYIIELNRFIAGHKLAFFPVIGLCGYNLYNALFFLYDGLRGLTL